MTDNAITAPPDDTDPRPRPRIELTYDEARAAELLQIVQPCSVSAFAIFCPYDELGRARPIVVEPGASIGAFTIVHGGTHVRAGARVEDRVVVGAPELGYAVRAYHPGAGAPTEIGSGSVLRSGAIVYAGTRLGPRSAIGHHSLIRSHVTIGAQALLGHSMTIERGTRIGDRVRCSPATHLTSDTVVEDDVFLGAGVRTINDNGLDWEVGGSTAALRPPYFATGARVGSGAVILGGVRIGARALVGAGAVVTRDVDPDTTVYGNPARPHPTRPARSAR